MSIRRGLTIKTIGPAVFTAVALLIGAAPSVAETGGDPPAISIPRVNADLVVAADGSYVQTLHTETLANNDAAAMHGGQKSIGYIASMQKVEVLEAYTLKKDGQKIPVDASAIYDQLPPGMQNLPMFTDIRQKTIVFPQYAAGDTAVFTVRITSQPFFPNQFEMLDMFPRSIVVGEARDTITVPKSMALQIESDGVSYTKKEAGDNVVYTWTYANPTPVPDNDPVFINAIGHNPRFYVSTLKDYSDLGRLFAEAAEPKMAVTRKVRDLADTITKGTADRREQTRQLYEWVSGHIRYVAEELGKGSLIPHDADAIISNGYGDCKDHVVLLAALLKAKGIESKPVLINAHNEYELPNVATFSSFDHVINWVPEFDLYMDSTAVVAPFGSLPGNEYGKPVVIATVNDSHQATMPLLPPGLTNTFTKTVEAMDKDGILTGTTTTETSGPASIMLRYVGLGAQTLGPENAASRLLTSLGYKDATGRLDAPPPLQSGPNYSVSGTFRATGWKEEAAGSASFYLPGGMRLMGLSGDGLMGPFRPGKLKDSEPVPCFNGREAEEISLAVPQGMHFAETPKDLSIKTANISFTARWTVSGDTIAVRREFIGTIDKPFCTADIRKANLDALKQIGDSYDTTLYLTSESANASSGQAAQQQGGTSQLGGAVTQHDIDVLNQSEQAARRYDYKAQLKLLSSLLPSQGGKEKFYSVVYMRRADAYSSLDQYAAALSDSAVALKLDPSNTDALARRAQIYMRKNDDAHAVADLDRVISIAPRDEYYDMRGTVLIRMGQYRRAIPDLDRMLRKWPDNLMDLQLRGTALIKTGRFDEAVSDLRRAAAHDTTDADLHALYCQALARSKKPNDAIAPCTLLLEYSPYMAEVMQWRGYAYYRLGNFARAQRDFDSAARMYPNEAMYLFERGAAKLKAGDKPGGARDIAAARKMSPAVAKKVAELNISG